MNDLPLIKSDRTNAFYRRLLVLRMDRVPSYANPKFQEMLLEEIDYFIYLIVTALERMYSNGRIIESLNSKRLVEDLRWDSDTVEAWIKETMTKNPESRIDRTRLYNMYCNYCMENERSSLSQTNFYKALKSKGFSERKSNGKRYIIGLDIKESDFIPINEISQANLPFI